MPNPSLPSSSPLFFRQWFNLCYVHDSRLFRRFRGEAAAIYQESFYYQQPAGNQNISPSLRIILDFFMEICAGGVTSIQVREKNCSLSEFIQRARFITNIVRFHIEPALGKKIPVIVNDSLEVGIAVQADGIHLGAEDTDLREADQVLSKHLPAAFLGYSLERESSGAKETDSGCRPKWSDLLAQKYHCPRLAYISLSPVFSSKSKDDGKSPPWEVSGLRDFFSYLSSQREATAPAPAPLRLSLSPPPPNQKYSQNRKTNGRYPASINIGIGGITSQNHGLLRQIGLEGVAVISALMEAKKPKEASMQLSLRTRVEWKLN